MFRDESSHVIKKAKARARKKGANLTVEPATPSSTGSEGRLSLTPEPRSRTLSMLIPATPGPSSPTDNGVWPYDDSLLMSPESGSWPVTPPAMARLYNLAPSCQEQGTAYFFSRYVNAEETACHQKFDFLRDVWNSSSTVPERQVDGVLASMTAVGLMGFASLTRSDGLMDAARKSYGTALGLTKDALKDPAEAIKDSTMLSILILGVFEMMVENPARDLTVRAFQEHVNGAVALAIVRGPAQFQTRAGRRMFSMLCQRAVISCAQRDEPMPQPLIELWHEMAKTLDTANPTRHLMPLVWQVLQLRSDIKQGNLIDPEIIISQLLAIEQEFEKLTNNLPLSWQYRSLKVTQYHPAVYGGHCHLYSSIHQANFWNSIRTTRILLLETIISEIYSYFEIFPSHYSSSQYIQELNRARRKLRRVVADVVASVPQHLGLMDSDGTIESLDPGSTRIATVEVRQTPSPPTSPSSRSTDSGSNVCSPFESRRRPSGLTILDVTKAQGEEESERYMHLVSATSTVVWPLYLVGMSTACTEEMKTYVIGRLRTLYMETSIKQADAIANILEEHETAAPVWLDEERQEITTPNMMGAIHHQQEDYGFAGLELGLSPLHIPLPMTFEERDVVNGGNMNDLVWT